MHLRNPSFGMAGYPGSADSRVLEYKPHTGKFFVWLTAITPGQAVLAHVR